MSFGGGGGLYYMEVLFISGRIDPAEIPELCERARALLERAGNEPVVCDVGSVVDPDVATVDALARLQLTATRLGRQIGLRNPGARLSALVAFMGLAEVVPRCEELGVQAIRQVEKRKEVLGVEEEADAGDVSTRDLEDL